MRAGKPLRSDGRFPTARFVGDAGQATRLDGRSPTAHFVVLSARSLRPRLDSLPDARLLDGTLPWTSASQLTCTHPMASVSKKLVQPSRCTSK